ncbi:MAG: hypothetical protein LUC91_06225 [Prevotella sp.]|nr:hypothetical protein [Prevotella sp.]
MFIKTISHIFGKTGNDSTAQRRAIALLFLSVAMLAFTLSSCSSDTDEIDTQEESTPTTLGLTIMTRSTSTDGYEDGSTYENYIDIANGDYRIYFFDNENKYIARFETSSFVATSGSNYTTYQVLGEAPGNMVFYLSDFKVVVLANWGKENYDDESLIVGKTTIDNICEAESSKYGHKDDFELSTSNLIPMYGVREYKNIEIEDGTSNLIDEPITLLRAMAKVEVILDGDISAFTEVNLCHYNDKGYCAPSGVYDKSDYDHDLSWDEDYVSELHLVNGSNDTEQDNHKLAMMPTVNSDGNYMWIAYVPEYDNSGDDYCYIEIKTIYQYDTDVPFIINFAKYNDDGTTGNDTESRYNIERNNLYRFRVTYDHELEMLNCKLQIIVQEWETTFDNTYYFYDEYE